MLPDVNNNCEVNLSRNTVSAACDDSIVHFQMIVQSSDLKRVHKLYINQTTDNETTAGVTVKETGQFHVTIFGVREESGILDSIIEYSGEVKASNNDSYGIMV